MILIFYLGFLFKRYESKINCDNLYFSILCIVGLLVNTIYGKVVVNRNSYLSPDFLLFNTVLGVYFNIYLSRIIVEKNIKVKKYLNYIGENSIIVIALHFLSFKIIDLIQIIVYDLQIEILAKSPLIDSGCGWWIAYSIIGLAIPILIQIVIDIIKIKKNEYIKFKEVKQNIS